MSLRKVASAATTNSTLVFAGKRNLDRISLYNSTAAVKWFKVYDKATAPVVGTDVPIATLAIPANGALNLSNLKLQVALGLGFGITGAVADNDTTATAINDVVGIIDHTSF